METAFLIMAFGHPELDRVADEGIVPALQACGLDAKRVDRDSEGGLIKAEIMKFINEAQIIIGDLTFARPNCYLEVGYSMGVDKNSNLILTVREDHFQDSQNYAKDKDKLHFDITGYDVLRWWPDKIPDFRTALEQKIRRRLLVVAAKSPKETSPERDNWFLRQAVIASPGLDAVNKSAHMDIRLSLSGHERFELPQLRDVARRCQIETFGWPIGVFPGDENSAPRPRADGIFASVHRWESRSYDYWALRRNGDFYLCETLFEDHVSQDVRVIFFDTQIYRVTEALLYCARLYTALGMGRQRVVGITIQHFGLEGRSISSATPRFLRPYAPISANEFLHTESVRLEQIETDLVELVKAFLAPLFSQFGFFQLDDERFRTLVNGFVAGKLL